MKTISLQKYAPVITMKNIKVVNQDIHEGMQSNQPFAIDFKGIEGIEMAAASELLNPLRKKYGTRYRQEVQFQNVEPLVGNAFVFSGSTAHSTTTANSRRRSFFSRMFFSLLFLLTLGVGQMWADTSGTIYITPANMWGETWDYSTSKLKIAYNYNPGDSWTGEQDMTKTDYTFHNYPVYSYTVSSSTNYAKIFVYHFKGSTKQATYNVGGDQWIDFSGCLNKMYNGWHNSAHEWLATSEFDANTEVTVYYAYQNTNDYTIKANMRISNDYDVWRTYTMTSTGHMIGNKTIYKCTFNDFREHLYVLQFQRHNGSGYVSQDQPINNSWTAMSTYGSKMYNGSSWVAYQYDVVLDQQDGSGGTPSITATCGSAMPGSKTAPSRTGYTFGGYYTEEDGGGIQYYTSAMASARNWPSDGTGPNRLYAKWTAKQTTVTLYANAPDGEIVTGGGTTVTATYDSSLPSFSALSCTGGYNLTGYWTDDDGGTKIINANGTFAANSGIWNRTDGGTLSLYAQWDKTNTLTVSAGSGVSSVTGSQDPVTLNTKYAISATANTGYTFSGWTASPVANAVFDDAMDASTNVTVKNGSVTVTGAATENMTTVTVNVSPAGAGTLTKGGSAFTPGNTVSVGVTTGYSMVATENTGYVFHDWTKTGNAAGTPSTNTFPLKGNGSAGTGTLTANFGIASGWHMEGEDFGGWSRPTTHQLTYPYRGMDGVYYIPTTLTKDSWWKVNNNSKPYNTSNSSNIVAKGTIYSLVEEYTNSSKVSSTLSDIWVVVNTSGKKLWLQDPQTFHNVNVSGADNDKGPVKVTLKTTSAFTKGDNVFETTQYANGETFTVTVTGVSGYIPTITIGGVSKTWWKEQATYTADGTMSSADVAVTISYTPTRALTFANTTGCNTLSATGPNSVAVTTGTKIKDGTSITFTQTNTTGYTFSKWYSNNTGTSGTEYATTSSYLLTVSSTAYTIYPIYTENSYSVSVSVSPAATGSISSPTPEDGKITVKQVTGTSVTASPATNYVFKDWTYSGGGLTSSSTTQTSTFKATTTGGSIQANFADQWNVKGSGTELGSWSEYNGMPNVSSNTFSKSFTLPARTAYSFKIVKRANAGGSDKYYGVNGGKTLTRGSNSVTGLAENGGVDENISFTTDAAGTYTITYVYNANVGSMSVTVGYPTAYTVEFGSDGHGTVTASATSAGGSFTSGEYVAASDVVTFAQTPATGYTFKGWYTTPSGSTSADLNGDNELTINAAKTVYAQYTANTYVVTFDYDDNGGSKTSGDDQNNATYDQATITTPVVYKDGYCLDGWYSAASDGVKVIDKDGNLQPNVSVSATTWTDGDGKWKKDGTATVYAVYTLPTIEMSASPTVLNVKKPEKDTVVIHQTFSCMPTGTYNVVYTVGYSANHTQLAPQPTIIYGTAGYDSIVMPMASANTYEIVAELHTGSTPGPGTLLKRDTINYAVEDEYSVTLHYMVDGVQIRSSRTVSAYSSATETPVEVRVFIEESGYELDHWEMGVGIDSIPDRGSIIDGGSAGPLQSKYIYAANNGNIYLHYKPKTNTVYFFNTFSMYWYSPIMKKYDYGTSTDYWNNNNESGTGAGSKKVNDAGKITPDTVKSTTTSLEEKRWMASIGASTTNFAFVSEKKDQQHFWGLVEGNEYPKVIYRTDYNAATPMFVPVSTDVTSDYYILNQASDGEAHYYRGFWVKYSPNPDSTGYYLKVYNGTAYGSSLVESIPLRLTQTGEGNTWELTASMDLEANKTYGFKFTKATGTSSVDWYTNASTMTAADHEGLVFTTASGNNCGLTTTSAGDYTFHVFCKDFGTKNANTASASEVQGQLAVTVDYATVSGDYRVIYKDATQTEWIASPSIHPVANGQDTVSFFIRKSDASRVMKIQKYDTNWTDFGDPVDLSSITKDSVYVIYLQQNEAGDDIEVAGYDFYDGDYYIRTDCVDEHKWDYKQSLDNHRMNASDYGMSETQPVRFTHYYVHWVDANGNVKFVVANKYAPCISDTLITDAYANVAGGNLPNAGASVRFMYNKGTNNVARAYLAGAQGGAYTPNYLKLRTSTDSLSNATGEPAPIDSITFTDLKNFVYQAEIKAKPGLTATLTAQYNGNTQYFKGSSSEEEEILGGTGDAWHSLLLTYDFKVNRLICAWQPSGDSIEGNTPINADVMIIRTGQEDAQQIVFKTNDSKLSSVKYIYGVMQFNYDDMVGNMYTWGPTAYELCMYYISFPYDVLVNDIMAPGRMGTEWRIQRYNGAKRAKGWFAGDGVTTFWEDVQSGDTLHAYEGYSLLLNRRIFNDGSSTVWANKGAGSKLYMYFPSKDATTGVVANKSVDVTVPSHECTLDRVFDQDLGKPINEQRNHKIVDSHWNMIGTPLFEDHVAATITDGPTVEGETLQYIYAWNPAGNSLGIQNTLSISWEFKTMYSYMAQYAGTITFTGSAVGDVVAAPRRTPKENYTLNLELTKDEMFIGRTYVELRENAVDSFLLNEDVYMVKNGVTADLYTFAGAYEAGANVMSVGSHTIPVGIDVKTAGTYTFSMPSNFSGTVTLIDTYAQTRTNLNIEDYEVTLNKGTIDNRFFLEIDIANAPTAIDGASDGQGTLKDGKAHKFIMNDQMYILKDGVIYDARGSRVK